MILTFVSLSNSTDLEYNKIANPDITNAENECLLNDFINELSSEISNTFNIAIDRRHVVDLDSSTEKKFSRHLIVHMPNGELFRDAPTCGVFVKKFVGRIAEEVATGTMEVKRPTLAKYLFVNDKSKSRKEAVSKTSPDNIIQINSQQVQAPEPCAESGRHFEYNKTCFVDVGVYTRNRLFRLLGSSKFGKPTSAALRIASVNQFPFPDGFTNELFYHQVSVSKTDVNYNVSVDDTPRVRCRNNYNSDDNCVEQCDKKRKVSEMYHYRVMFYTALTNCKLCCLSSTFETHF